MRIDKYPASGIIREYFDGSITMDRDTFTGTIRAFKQRSPFRPFTVVTMSGSRHEIDHFDAIVVRDGMAMFAAPGGIPVIFDHESVDQVVGDLAGRGVEV